MKTIKVELNAGTAEIGIVDIEMIQKVIKARKAIEIRNITEAELLIQGVTEEEVKTYPWSRITNTEAIDTRKIIETWILLKQKLLRQGGSIEIEEVTEVEKAAEINVIKIGIIKKIDPEAKSLIQGISWSKKSYWSIESH